jgi:hypothetical protein
MRLRFVTSVASDRGYYHEGRVIELTKHTPETRAWLNAGLVVPVRDTAADKETHAVTPPAPETAAVGARPSRARAGD